MSVKWQSLAGMTGKYRVTLDDGEPVEVDVIAADVMRWEQNHSRAFFEGDSVSFSRMAWVAWAAMRRTHKFDGEVAAFFAHLHDLERENTDEDGEDEGEVELPGPTQEEVFTG